MGNPFKKLKERLSRNSAKENQVVPFHESEVTPQSITQPIDPELINYLWTNFKGKKLIPAEGYGKEFMTLLKRKLKTNKIVPSDVQPGAQQNKKMAKAGLVIEGGLIVAGIGQQIVGVSEGDRDMGDPAGIAAFGFADGLQEEAKSFTTGIGMEGVVPILAQVVNACKLVKAGNDFRVVHNEIGACEKAHIELLKSLTREIGVIGLLSSLDTQRENCQIKIGKYSMYMAVTFVPGGSAIRAVTELGLYALNVVHAIKMHDLITKVNNIIKVDQENPPKGFNLALFRSLPLLANYLFLYPGTSTMLGITPAKKNPTSNDLEEVRTKLTDKSISLDDHHKKFAKNMREVALKRVKAAPYVLSSDGINYPPFLRKLKKNNSKMF